MMRNQIIKSIKVSGLVLEALSAAAAGNFIRIHRTISPLSPDKCVLLPAGTRRGALPAPALQDGGLCFSSAASAREQNPPHAHPSPSPITAAGTRGAGTMCRPFASPSCDPLESSTRRSWTGVTAPSLPTFSLRLRALVNNPSAASAQTATDRAAKATQAPGHK